MNGNHRPNYRQSSSSNNPHYYPRSSSSSASFKGCFCCLFLLFSFLLLLLLAIALVVILAVKPKKPQFDLQQVAVQYVGITPSFTSPTSASLSLSIKLLFAAVNPNKVGIKYGDSTFTVMYREIPLGRASVQGFYHSQRQVETTVSVNRINLEQAAAADIVKDASLYDQVELQITGDTSAKIRVMDITSPQVEQNPDYAGVHEAIREFDWNPEVRVVVTAFSECYTDKVFQLLLSAYSTISIQDAALFMGMNEDEVTKYVLERGWTVDSASQTFTVKKQPIVKEQKLDVRKLQSLTEYVVHLEHQSPA